MTTVSVQSANQNKVNSATCFVFGRQCGNCSGNVPTLHTKLHVLLIYMYLSRFEESDTDFLKKYIMTCCICKYIDQTKKVNLNIYLVTKR